MTQSVPDRATLGEPDSVARIIGDLGDEQTLQDAYDIIGDTLRRLDLSEGYDEYVLMQDLYFSLKAALLARDPEFQHVDLPGTRVHVPANPYGIDPNPVVEDEHGEFEVPTSYDSFRVMDSVAVAEPKNPHTKHQLHIDHVIEPGGELNVEIDGKTIDETVSEFDT